MSAINITIVTPPVIKVQIGAPSGRTNVTIGTAVIAAGTESYVIQTTAGETVSGGKAVIVDDLIRAWVFDINNEAHSEEYVGIANHAALVGESLAVTVWGKLKEVGSGWRKGTNYWIGANGVLGVTAPSHGVIFPIAIGIDTDTILINNTSFRMIAI